MNFNDKPSKTPHFHYCKIASFDFEWKREENESSMLSVYHYIFWLQFGLGHTNYMPPFLFKSGWNFQLNCIRTCGNNIRKSSSMMHILSEISVKNSPTSIHHTHTIVDYFVLQHHTNMRYTVLLYEPINTLIVAFPRGEFLVKNVHEYKVVPRRKVGPELWLTFHIGISDLSLPCSSTAIGSHVM